MFGRHRRERLKKEGKKMKKWMSLVLVCMLLFSCAACAPRDVAEQSDGAEASGDACKLELLLKRMRNMAPIAWPASIRK